MDRFRVWMEARSEGSITNNHQSSNGITCPYRPPPLCTSSNFLVPGFYDLIHDDDAFQQVALSLLSRHNALGITPLEAIKLTLSQPSERANFWEGLQARCGKCRNNHLSPSAISLLENLDRTFSQDLRKIVESERYSINTQRHDDIENGPPCSPRHMNLPVSSSAGSSNGSSSSGSSTSQGINPSLSIQPPAPKKRKNRRFFPDCDAVFNMRSRGARVQNIDWKLAEAISHVQSLRLDGDRPPVQIAGSPVHNDYEPPTMGENSY